MSKILILIGGHLCNAPRPQKEAKTLADAGYDVTVCGIWFDSEFAKRDRLLIANQKYKFEAIIDLRTSRKFTNYYIRIKKRIAKELFRSCKIFSPELLNYGTEVMLKYAQNFCADLTIVHSESGLWIGKNLLDRGFNVGVDFEDWFSEDLLLESRIDRPTDILRNLERDLANKCQYCLTTSHALAEALAKTYQSPKPTTIYNAFSWAERSQIDGQICDRQNLDIPSLHWFSQTIGQGRGLEVLFQSLQYINRPVEIHLRGNYSGSSRQWIESQIPQEWRDLLFIHPTVNNSELLSRIAEHDIGLALEIPYCFNKQFTASNKLFQYLLAGLAVIATNTQGQQEILSLSPEIGELIPCSNAIKLAEAINRLVNNHLRLSSSKKAALSLAQETLNWENQENIILRLAKIAINK